MMVFDEEIVSAGNCKGITTIEPYQYIAVDGRLHRDRLGDLFLN